MSEPYRPSTGAGRGLDAARRAVATRLQQPGRPGWQLLHMAELARASAWYYLLLPIPLILARSCERRWQAVERDRVLDRDRFAWQCGEGWRLRNLLVGQLDSLNRIGKPDNTVPTLAERIDHLDSLRRKEGRQVKELRATLPPPPSSPPAAS